MCGISGFYFFDKSAKASVKIISAMTTVLRHRGPDDEQHFVEDNYALGSNRLAIIDPENGKQPAFNETSSIAAVLNGEIYNFREISSWLISKGHNLNSRSDTEIVPHLYEELGADFPERLEGMFSIAVLDLDAKRMLLVRDRIGIKPLYYFNDNDSLAFASEVKALLNFPAVKKSCNIKSIIDYFTLGYILTPHTAYESIHSLPPAHILISENGRIKIRKYWELSCDPAKEPNEEAIEKILLQKLQSSVKSHLLSDVPVGAFLSGGLDSSLISSLMNDISGNKINTFTANLWYQNRQDSDFADNVAVFLKSRHERVDIGAEGPEEIISIISAMDEPFADSSFIPTFLISREASKKLKVVLSGDGSDENFAGYPGYLADKLRNGVHNSTFSPVLLSLAGFSASIAEKIKPDQRIEKFKKGIGLNPFNAHLCWRTVFSREEQYELFTDKFTESEKDYFPESIMKEHYDGFRDYGELNRMLFLDIKTWLVDDILKKVDMASMANSLEVRVPFLDRKIVEFAASVPEKMKLKGREGKYILKKCAIGRVPEKIIKRRKKGFNLPLEHLIRNDLKDLTLSLTSSDKRINHPELNWGFINKLVYEHINEKKDYGQKLWTIICYIIWKEKSRTL